MHHTLVLYRKTECGHVEHSSGYPLDSRGIGSYQDISVRLYASLNNRVSQVRPEDGETEDEGGSL